MLLIRFGIQYFLVLFCFIFTSVHVQNITEIPSVHVQSLSDIPLDHAQNTTGIPSNNVQDLTEIPSSNVQNLTEILSNNVQNLTEIPSDDVENISEIVSVVNGSLFDNEEKQIVNLNSNCTTNDDCNAKKSICDITFNTCECDITTMQVHRKCKTIHCQSDEECTTRYPDTSCTFSRCQCISGRKINGKCVRSIGHSNGLPDWAIIIIALSVAISVLLGGSLKKAHLLSFIRIMLQKYDSNDSNTNNSNINDNEL